MYVRTRREENRLGEKNPTTEQAQPPQALPEWLSEGLPPKVSALRCKLYCKAKQEPDFRFYALYDRIYRLDVLQVAWELVRHNHGAAGPDGVTIDQIVAEDGAATRLVQQLHDELRTKTYHPGPIRRVYIPKPDGRLRPLGIPNVRDRIAQTAAKLILEPIFEPSFLENSHGFRPERNAHDALDEVQQQLKEGRTTVYDADLEGYFDSIPHDKLMAAVSQRISDRSVLSLLRSWLTAIIIDEQGGGPPKRSDKGSPQGGVISPLLSNIYLHWFDRAFHGKGGPNQSIKAVLVRYADDFVILTRYRSAKMEEWLNRVLTERLGLRLNATKTRTVQLKEEGSSVDFLGYTFRYDRDLHGREHRYLNVFPSKRALSRARERLRELTSAQMCYKPVRVVISEVNEYLEGWKEYFGWGYPRVAMRHINRVARVRLSVHLKRRSQRRYRPPEGKSIYGHLADLGLVYL